jgi:hypothetical protein
MFWVNFFFELQTNCNIVANDNALGNLISVALTGGLFCYIGRKDLPLQGTIQN